MSIITSAVVVGSKGREKGSAWKVALLIVTSPLFNSGLLQLVNSVLMQWNGVYEGLSMVAKSKVFARGDSFFEGLDKYGFLLLTVFLFLCYLTSISLKILS
jgi:hypothetical protein